MKFFGTELVEVDGIASAKIAGGHAIVQYRIGAWIASYMLEPNLIITEALTSNPDVDRSEEVLRLLENKVRKIRTKLEQLTAPPESTRVDSGKAGA